MSGNPFAEKIMSQRFNQSLEEEEGFIRDCVVYMHW